MIKKINKKTFFSTLFSTGFIVLLSVFMPTDVSAATISASSDALVNANDTAIIRVYLNTEGETINSIDGSIVLTDEHKGNFEIKELSLVNSSFTMWPRKPSLEEGRAISFVGGVPGGVTGEKLLLFSVVVKINQEGKFTISPKVITSFLNDGLGTTRNITKNSSTINIGTAREKPQDVWKEIISNDNNAPEPFTIELIQDQNLYDGKKFISFETTDKESGISHYEVTEGNNPPVRTGTQYVLIDQDGTLDVIVAAYDKAGNFQTSTFVQKKAFPWASLVMVCIGVTILYLIIRKLRKRKRNANQVH